ncbi:MAG: sigma 54-interacting transcriptional regulator [Myxococcaceae bacterium]|nr:sigma 54-interacting transcriptional regulator [Myxococcaceae bacterium]
MAKASAKTEVERGGAPGSTALRLLVFRGELVSSFPLPASGTVILGRAEDAEVQLDWPAISRHHARLHLGATLQVEDLGSANGTTVRGQALALGERAPLRAGESFELGSAVALIQTVGAHRGLAPVRRVWSYDAFEARLDEECARAERTGQEFSLLRVEGPGPRVAELVAAGLRPQDALASVGPQAFEALLPGATSAESAAVARTLEGRGLRVAVARWPVDGRSAAALRERAMQLPGSARAARVEPVIEDPAMRALYALVPKVGPSDVSVLVQGETGTGKELIAQAIHRASRRASGPLLSLNCGAFAPTLLESELFGHEQGAFTGAHKARAGLLESASGGTVFLDELGELPLELQAKLLRVVEQREVLRVGATQPRPIDVRFVSATHRELAGEAAAGRFRQDLYYRLAGITLELPPLRDRPAELAPLARRFAEAAAVRLGRPKPKVSNAALEALARYDWPGNVRELKNVIERAVLLSPDAELRPEELPLQRMGAQRLDPVGNAPGDHPDERERIIAALERCAGNQTLAAEVLGISRRTLVSRLDQLRLPRPRKRQPRRS